MVHTTCSHEGCSKAPSFGFSGGERVCCSEHKRPGMQYLKHGRSDHHGSASQEQSHVPRGLDYAPSVARDPELARHHHSATAAAAGSSGVLKDRCRFNGGCTKAASFGFPDGERVFCSAHKRPGMQYLAALAEHHRGGAGAALTQAMDHVPRGLDYRHSSTNQHTAKQADTVSSGQPHVASDGKHCQEEGCTKAPSYGWEGVPGGEGSIAVMCAQHKRPAMIYLRHPLHSDDASAEYTRRGGHIPPASSKDKNHVPKGLEYIPSVTAESDRIVHSDHPHCRYKGCTKAPSYGLEGHAGIYCFSHKRPGMVFLKRSPTGPKSDTSKHPEAAKAHAKDSNSHKEASASAKAADAHQESGAGNSAACPSAPCTAHEPDFEAGEAIEADLCKARSSLALARERSEDTTVGLKYLNNIVKHPDDIKYRTLKTSNRKFYTEVWLNCGVRGIFTALGFRGGDDGTLVLNPLTPNTLEAIATIVQELEAAPGGVSTGTSVIASGAAFPRSR